MQAIDLKAIGARLKTFREDNIGDQATLAKEAGVNVKTISFVENGHTPPSQKLLSTLAQKYSLNLDWVNSGRGKPKSDKKADPKSLPNLHAKVVIIERELSEMRAIMEQILERLK